MHVFHYHQAIGEQPAVGCRDRHRHAQTFMVKVPEELGLPREVSVAPDTQTTDCELPMDAHAPDIIGNSPESRSMRAAFLPHSSSASHPTGDILDNPVGM